MALGRPAITEPARLELRAVQQAIANIRERFKNTDAVIGGLQDADTAAALARASANQSLQSQLDELDRRVTILEGLAREEFTVRMFADEAIDVGSPVRVTGQQAVANCDPDNLLESAAYLGIAASAASAGDEVDVRLPGGIVEISGSAFTTWRPLYAQLGGVTHFPAGNSLPVGVAISADAMAVGYGFNVLGDETFDPTGQDDMAVTYGLAGAASDSGGVLPVVTGEILNAQPVFVYLDDGSLVYSPIG